MNYNNFKERFILLD